ncbi:hypothetical protein QE152_g8772 [Popillia japonica]|uniref:Uncharacterized protein n=1 Tax=Popillia japonica TaxID=7064 RepID=A0AAW1LX70_POPJA
MVTGEGKGSIIVFIITIVLILAIVIAGICVSLLLDRKTANIILYILIGVLLILGLLSFLYIRRENSKAMHRREIAYQERATRRVEASAPPMSTRTSWALKKPWRYSDRSTVPINHNNHQYNNNNNQYA